MQRLVLLACGLCIPFIHALHLNEAETLTHVEPVLNFRMVGHNEGPQTIEHGHVQPHADEVEITFSAFNQEWNFVLYCDHDLFAPTSRFRFFDETGEHTTVMPDHTVYKTKAGEFPWASINVYEDKTIHAMIGTDEDIFSIDPKHHFPEFPELETEMGMYRHSDTSLPVEIPSQPEGAASRSLMQAAINPQPDVAAYPTTDFSKDETPIGGIPTKWNTGTPACYPNQAQERKFAMGMAVSFDYYNDLGVPAGGTTATSAGIIAHLKNLLADSNTIYTPQMGVHLYIATTDIRTAAGVGGNPPAPWNLQQTTPRAPSNANAGCRESASTMLGKLRTWRLTNHPNDAGLWHLMTTCFPAPGTVGIAYLNAICQPRIGSGLSSILSQTRPGSRAIWKVVAHEIGHNFGGEHSFELGQGTTGGIMDYGDGKLTGVYQFNTRFRRTQVCQRIATTLAANANAGQSAVCWSTYVAPTTPGGVAPTFAWESTTPPTFGTCSTTCDPGIQVEILECIKTEGGVKTVEPNVILCGNKPNGATQACNLGACPAASCGDGIVQTTNTLGVAGVGLGEQCDPGQTADPCCIECRTVTSNPACQNNLDACFVSIKNEKTYCFRGATYSRFTPATGTMDATYPRTTGQYWAGPNEATDPGFYNDIDAIVQRTEGRIYFIKGSKYSVYELGFGKHNGYPQTALGANGFFGLPTSWTKVDAAISTRSGQGGAYLFNDQEYCYFGFDPASETCIASTRYPRPLADWNGGQPFPLAKVTAASRYWPGIGGTNAAALDAAVDMHDQGKFVRYKFGEGIVAVAGQTSMLRDTTPWPAMNTGGAPTASGSAPTASPGNILPCATGCRDCTGNTCNICEDDYDLVSGRCYPTEYVVEMLFDVNTNNNLAGGDKRYVLATNVPDNLWNTAQGNTGNCVTLDIASYIQLDAQAMPTDMQDWEFHFWVKLNPSHGQVITNLVAGKATHGGAEFEFRFYLDPCPGQTETDCYIPTYSLLKAPNAQSPFGDEYTLPSQYIVRRNKWDHLIATLERGNMKLTIDGAVVSMPYDFDMQGTGVSRSPWRFSNMEVGQASSAIPSAANIGGINGYLDQFHIDRLSTYTGGGLDSYSSRSVHFSSFLLLFIAIMAIVM